MVEFRDVVKKYAGTDEALGVPAGTVGGIPVVTPDDLGPAAAMTPAEVVTDPAAQAALSATFAPRAAGIEGTGMPEGVVTAPVGTVYRDLAATNGAVVWVKATGTGNTGWRVMWGDTGLRNIDSLVSAPNLSVVQARLQRVGSVVSLSLGVTTSQGWASDTSIATIPAGFRLVGSLTRFLPPGYSAVNQARLTAAGDLRLYGSSTGTSRAEWQWLTADAWPTTLPGTAA